MPKVNLVGVIAGALTLISITLAWWGANGPLGYSANLTFFGTTPPDPILSQIMLVFLGFVVIIALVGFFGSIYPRSSILLLGSFSFSVMTAILFAVVLNDTIIAECKASGSSTCINGIVGSSPTYGATWGFQIGFYLFVASGVLFLLGAVVHGFFMLPRSIQGSAVVAVPNKVENVGKSKYCSDCGSSVSGTAKFCSNCASPLHFS